MPGIHLNPSEKQLQGLWDSGKFGEFPTLKSIEIKAHGDVGLRGITELRFDIQYPVTFLAGQNGSGKSTLLALAALAYHGAPGHIATFPKSWASHPEGDFSYYTFRDFFHSGPGDPTVKDVEISWMYDGRTKDISLVKKSDKWMRYERRPVRPVEYFGISRTVPSIELSFLRHQFGANIPGLNAAPLTPEAIVIIEKVLGRQYPNVEELNGKKSRIRRTSSNGYTSFNMGAGEDSLIALVAKLSLIPVGSLVVIDEVETTLHPAAQRKLAAALIELSILRKIQIIGSTHSHHILDSLPRVARTLIIKEGQSHRILPSPTARFALSNLSGQQHKELLLLCEDEFAASLISSSLPATARKRIEIHACGSKNELARYARSYLKVALESKCLVVWDGDVSDQEAQTFFSRAKAQVPTGQAHIDERLHWITLPGEVCPELWALNIVRNGDAELAAEAFGFDNGEQAAEALRGCGVENVHSIPYEIGQQAGLSEVNAATRLVGRAVNTGKEELESLVTKIQTLLG